MNGKLLSNDLIVNGPVFLRSGAIRENRLIVRTQPRSLRIVAAGMEMPELQVLQSAVGWTELGLPQEALRELDALPPSSRKHPDALEVRWLILSDLKNWDEAVIVSGQLIERAYDRPTSWLHHAYGLRRSSGGGLTAAFESLSSVASRFPKEPIIHYNIACYACQLGRPEQETMQWFERALHAGDSKKLLAMALKDSDLEPVWPLIRQRSRNREVPL